MSSCQTGCYQTDIHQISRNNVILEQLQQRGILKYVFTHPAYNVIKDVA